MAFDWNTIAGAPSAEQRIYRLLGEMLHRRASDGDLVRLRAFLALDTPEAEAFHSLGEAIFNTTRGSDEGYEIWNAWARQVAGIAHDEAQVRAAWQRFRMETSELLEDGHPSEPFERDFDIDDPPTLPFDHEFDDSGDDIGSMTRVLAAEEVPAALTGILGHPSARLLSFLPTGPYSIRLLGELYTDVHENTLLALLRRGMFLGVEVLLGGRWVRVENHPAFEGLVRNLRDEARRVMASQHCTTAENTRPGS